MLQSRPSACALGIDSGTHNTGVGIVNNADIVLYSTVLHPPLNSPILDRIFWLYDAVTLLMRQYTPVVVGIETYVAPSVKVRAQTAAAVAHHNWIIGSLVLLNRTNSPAAQVMLLEAKTWMHQLTGIPSQYSVGGKDIIEKTVYCRTGYAIANNTGYHRSDAVGIALVALDNYSANMQREAI